MAYDPAKRREYYLRTRELKGRKKGTSGKVATSKVGKSSGSLDSKASDRARSTAKIARLSDKVKRLNVALAEARKLLSEKRRSEQKSRETQRKEDKRNSDGKSTAKEKAAAKKYRDKNRAKIAEKEKSDSGPKKPSEMSIDELQTRVKRIESAIKSAKSQIREATKGMGST